MAMKKDDKRLIHKALDGEASQSETKRLQEKLASDGRVRSEFEQLKKVVKDTTKIRIDVQCCRDRRRLLGMTGLRPEQAFHLGHVLGESARHQ